LNCFDNFVSTLLQFLCTNHLKSMINKISPNASKIRRMAEELLKKGNSVSSLPVGPELDQSPALLQSEIQRLLYELEVHRTELKMQNDELILTKNNAQKIAEKYTKLFDFAPFGYFTLSRRGEIMELNHCGAAMLGRPRSLLKKSRFGFFVNAKTRPSFNQFLGNLFSTKEKGFCKLTLALDGNNTIDLFITGTLDDTEELCLVTAVDITSSRRTEDSLNRSEEKYRTIFENIQDVFYQTNLAGEVLEISPGIREFSEFGREEIIGFPVQNLYYNPDERQDLLIAITKRGELHDYELQIKTKTGKKKIVSINAKLIFNASGVADHIDGSMRDITRRTQAEEEVKKLQKAIENSNTSIIITDKKGNIEYANPYFTHLTGYTREEYTGKNPNVLKSGYHSVAFYTDLWQTIQSGQTWEGEFYNRKKDGHFFWENAVISPVQNEKNEITHYVAIKTDITAAKKINEELINAKLRAEESDNFKTAFLNNISHEIRTPFNGILGFLSILQNDDLTSDERVEYNKIISESAYRLMNTINDIAEVSAMQAGKLNVTESEVTISQLIEELTSHFTNDLNKKELLFTITNELPKNVTFIYTDRLKLNTILNNLLSNAIKFTFCGTIGLEIRLKGSQSDGDQTIYQRSYVPEDADTIPSNPLQSLPLIEFAVRDTGIGIPENKQQAIFERFIQADSSNTRKFEGSGLGTTIAKAYVEALGGAIRVESKEGNGSLFSFTIPFITESKEKLALKHKYPGKMGNMVNPLKILIAEDDETSLMFLETVVKPYAKAVLIAKTGQEAVRICTINPDIDLVLMDIQMPVLNGNDATCQIRLFNSTVIIIAQTAHALAADTEKAKISGCNDFISKPIQKGQLIALLHKYFSS